MPVELWGNATIALLFHEDIAMDAKISMTNHLKLRLPLSFKVIFVNHCHFRDLYVHCD